MTAIASARPSGQMLRIGAGWAAAEVATAIGSSAGTLESRSQTLMAAR